MATSGTTSFTMTRDELIGSALRILQVYGIGDTIPPEVVQNVAQALNIWVKALVTKGLLLWCVQDIEVQMVKGQSEYILGPATGLPRPMRILNASLRTNYGGVAAWPEAVNNAIDYGAPVVEGDSTFHDTILTITSRSDYEQLGNKSAAGIPNQLYYDPQLINGVMQVYNTPFDGRTTLRLTIQRQIQDFNLATDNPDFPQEAIQMLKWGLADEIGMEQGARDAVIDRVAQKARLYMTEFTDSSREEASSFFTPDGAVYRDRSY